MLRKIDTLEVWVREVLWCVGAVHCFDCIFMVHQTLLYQ
jgi:hypothetical protein